MLNKTSVEFSKVEMILKVISVNVNQCKSSLLPEIILVAYTQHNSSIDFYFHLRSNLVILNISSFTLTLHLDILCGSASGLGQ